MAEHFLKGKVGDIATSVQIENLGGKKRRLHITHTQDLQPLIDANRADRESGDRIHRKDNEAADQRPFCQIPLSTIMEWRKKFGYDQLARDGGLGFDPAQKRAFLRKLLNSPEYSFCKTFAGSL